MRTIKGLRFLRSSLPFLKMPWVLRPGFSNSMIVLSESGMIDTQPWEEEWCCECAASNLAGWSKIIRKFSADFAFDRQGRGSPNFKEYLISELEVELWEFCC